jgi:hypothetical protein
MQGQHLDCANSIHATKTVNLIHSIIATCLTSSGSKISGRILTSLGHFYFAWIKTLQKSCQHFGSIYAANKYEYAANSHAPQKNSDIKKNQHSWTIVASTHDSIEIRNAADTQNWCHLVRAFVAKMNTCLKYDRQMYATLKICFFSIKT